MPGLPFYVLQSLCLKPYCTVGEVNHVRSLQATFTKSKRAGEQWNRRDREREREEQVGAPLSLQFSFLLFCPSLLSFLSKRNPPSLPFSLSLITVAYLLPVDCSPSPFFALDSPLPSTSLQTLIPHSARTQYWTHNRETIGHFSYFIFYFFGPDYFSFQASLVKPSQVLCVSVCVCLRLFSSTQQPSNTTNNNNIINNHTHIYDITTSKTLCLI